MKKQVIAAMLTVSLLAAGGTAVTQLKSRRRDGARR